MKKNGIEWTGLDPERKEHLSEKAWAENYKGERSDFFSEDELNIFNLLKKTLLDFAGEEVCLPYFNPKDFTTINFSELAGYISKENAFIHEFLPSNNCHSNAVYLSTVIDESLELYTGYYMNKSGMWREHSWCVNPNNNSIFEPTNEGHCYFGVNLSIHKEIENEFIENNLSGADFDEIEWHLESNK